MPSFINVEGWFFSSLLWGNINWSVFSQKKLRGGGSQSTNYFLKEKHIAFGKILVGYDCWHWKLTIETAESRQLQSKAGEVEVDAGESFGSVLSFKNAIERKKKHEESDKIGKTESV